MHAETLEPAGILLVDDDEGSLALLVEILSPLGQKLVTARSGEEALDRFRTETFAVVLLDVVMPGLDGFETAMRMTGVEGVARVPIIFLTGNTDRGEIARGYQAGAVDYLLKPFEPDILRAKVEVFVDLHQLRRQAEILTQRALHDPLTGLPNRTLFLDRLDMALRRVERSGTRLALLFLDLDNFKEINDTLGHQAGDRLLVETGVCLLQAIRATDTAARFGGDEFLVLCDGIATLAEAEGIVERIERGLARIVAASGVELAASIGLAVAEGPGLVPEALIEAADAAMMDAKKQSEGRRSRSG